MKSFATIASLGIYAFAFEFDVRNFEYLNYMAKYNKMMVTDVEEFAMRAENFKYIDDFINKHNASGSSYEAGHNQFSDWTEAEYKQLLGRVGGRQIVKRYTEFETDNLADAINWVDAGAVTPVKDQGQCGSCWAFSTTGSLEGAHFVASGELLSFSEQQLVDCAYLQYFNYGCNGGLQTNAYMYYEDGFMAEIEEVYPYTSGTTKKRGTCQYDKSSATGVDVSTYKDVQANSVA